MRPPRRAAYRRLLALAPTGACAPSKAYTKGTPGVALTELLSTAALIATAELGDKSQLACLALSTRFRPLPVVFGALLAFGVLNALAVALGGVLGAWIPTPVVRGLAAGLFAIFGLQALLGPIDDEDEELAIGGGHPVLTTASLLALAELGDKTQLSVAALASVQEPLATWAGATLALLGTSTLAVAVGGWLLPRLPKRLVTRTAGVLFLAVASWLVLAA